MPTSVTASRSSVVFLIPSPGWILQLVNAHLSIPLLFAFYSPTMRLSCGTRFRPGFTRFASVASVVASASQHQYRPCRIHGSLQRVYCVARNADTCQRNCFKAACQPGIRSGCGRIPGASPGQNESKCESLAPENVLLVSTLVHFSVEILLH